MLLTSTIFDSTILVLYLRISLNLEEFAWRIKMISNRFLKLCKRVSPREENNSFLKFFQDV